MASFTWVSLSVLSIKMLNNLSVRILGKPVGVPPVADFSVTTAMFWYLSGSQFSVSAVCSGSWFWFVGFFLQQNVYISANEILKKKPKTTNQHLLYIYENAVLAVLKSLYLLMWRVFYQQNQRNSVVLHQNSCSSNHPNVYYYHY